MASKHPKRGLNRPAIRPTPHNRHARLAPNVGPMTQLAWSGYYFCFLLHARPAWLPRPGNQAIAIAPGPPTCIASGKPTAPYTSTNSLTRQVAFPHARPVTREPRLPISLAQTSPNWSAWSRTSVLSASPYDGPGSNKPAASYACTLPQVPPMQTSPS